MKKTRHEELVRTTTLPKPSEKKSTSYPWTYMHGYLSCVWERVCFLHVSLYLYIVSVLFGWRSWQTIKRTNLHERVRWMRKLAHHFQFCPLLLYCRRPVCDMLYSFLYLKCVYFFHAHTHTYGYACIFKSSIFSHSTRNFRSYVFTKLEAYAKYLCNINDFYGLVNGFFRVGLCVCACEFCGRLMVQLPQNVKRAAI